MCNKLTVNLKKLSLIALRVVSLESIAYMAREARACIDLVYHIKTVMQKVVVNFYGFGMRGS